MAVIRKFQYRWRHRVRRLRGGCSTPGCNGAVYIGTMCKQCAGIP